MHTRREFLKHAAISSAAAALPASRFSFAAMAALDPDATKALRASVSGQLIVPGDAAYETARHVVYVNPATQMYPAMVARCLRPDDVARCVEFARTHELTIAVRSGGHSFLGWGTCNGGMVIDVSLMKHVAIDPVARTARAGGGLNAQELVGAAAKYSLAPVLGECGTVGIAGLTLGGGVGWLSGKYGAACDNLLSADLITPDSRAIAASAESNPDLFWGVRGGGGNFGIATALNYRLVPVSEVLAGGFTYPLQQARGVLRFFREFMATAPDDLQTLAYLTPEGARGVNIIFVYAGDLTAGEKIVERFRAFAAPARDTVQRRAYSETFTMPPYGEYPLSAYSTMKGAYLEQLSDAAIDAAVEYFAKAPPGCAIGFDHYMHGAVCRVPPGSTAFELRAPGALHTWIFPGWSDPAAADVSMAWAETTWNALRPLSGGRMYANYPNAEGPPAAKATFGANYARLVALKKKYDPTNVLQRNPNVSPAGA